jgi:signal transduction histidine kinase
MQKDNLRDFLKATLISCMNLLESTAGSIFLFDNNKQELILKVACSSGNRRLDGIRQRLGEGISGMVAAEREPLLVKDIRKDSRFQNRQRFNHYRTNSFLSVPIMSDDKLVGVININDKASGKSFTLKDLRSVSLICNYIAPRLCEDIQKPGDEEQDRLKKFASIGKLVSGMAHELNNPLDGIIRFVNLSLECMDEEGIVREYLLNAKKGLNRIVNIIRALLDFAQSSSAVFNRPIDINKAIEDSLFIMSPYIQSNNIEVIRQFAQNLPEVCDNGLKLVFNNIIKNACDAIQEGGILKVWTGMRSGFIEIKFSDTGPGIPEEIRDKIFEPFFTTREMGKGSGLGLAICYDIIHERYKGKIFLEEGNKKGATFIIQLPVNGLKQEGESKRYD